MIRSLADLRVAHFLSYLIHSSFRSAKGAVYDDHAKMGVTYNSVLCLEASCVDTDWVLLMLPLLYRQTVSAAFHSGSLGSWMRWDEFGPWNPPVSWLEFTSWTLSFQRSPCWHRDVKTTARSGSTLNTAFQCVFFIFLFYNVGTVLFSERDRLFLCAAWHWHSSWLMLP